MFEDVDEYFFAIRDSSVDVAKQALYEMDITARHQQFDQTALFFIAARELEGASELAQIAVARGVVVDWKDKLKQTPLFYCARAGNVSLAQYLVSLGMSVHFKDVRRQTALFFAVGEQKLDMAEFLVEAGASLEVRDCCGNTPMEVFTSPMILNRLQELKLQQREKRETEANGLSKVEAETRKRKRSSEVAGDEVCRWSKARKRLLAWMDGREGPEDRAFRIDRHATEVISENEDYLVCTPPVSAAKRLRRSERQFVFDHAEQCLHLNWYPTYKPDDWCRFLGVIPNKDKQHIAVIEKAVGGQTNSFTLAGVEKSTNLVAGYVHAKREEKDAKDLRINHVKVDHDHQAKGLGGLLIRSAEKRSSELGWQCDTTSLIVMERNRNAKKCYAKDNFQMNSCKPGQYPSEAQLKDREHWCSMSRQHSFTELSRHQVGKCHV